MCVLPRWWPHSGLSCSELRCSRRWRLQSERGSVNWKRSVNVFDSASKSLFMSPTSLKFKMYKKGSKAYVKRLISILSTWLLPLCPSFLSPLTDLGLMWVLVTLFRRQRSTGLSTTSCGMIAPFSSPSWITRERRTLASWRSDASAMKQRHVFDVASWAWVNAKIRRQFKTIPIPVVRSPVWRRIKRTWWLITRAPTHCVMGNEWRPCWGRRPSSTCGWKAWRQRWLSSGPRKRTRASRPRTSNASRSDS